MPGRMRLGFRGQFTQLQFSKLSPEFRGDYGVDIILRLYAPDLQAFATWTSPAAELVE